MNTNNLKIAWRAAWKSKLFTVLNILGLAIGFAGFILAYAYINRENSYDVWNPNYDHIYLVGLTQGGEASDLTPAALAPAIQSKMPEVARIGRVASAPFEVPFISNDHMFYVKHWLGADKTIADIFAVQVDGLAINPSKESKLGILSSEVGKKLFPKEKEIAFKDPKPLALMNEESGVFENINGIAKAHPLSNFEYDYLALTDDIAAGKGDGDASVYQTYLQVKPGTDIHLLETKINALYKNEIAKAKETINTSRANSHVYLDPLKNLHLRPKHGSNTGYKITVALGVLSIIILLLACINFANLMLVQAQKRAKEIGMKKVFGVSRKQLTAQFLIEVFIQCLTAAAIASFLIVMCWNTLTKYFGYHFPLFDFNVTVFVQLASAVLFATLISGVYPALMLSGYRTIAMIKGSLLSGYQSQTFRNALLTFQFVIAFGFLSAMLIINQQMTWIKKGDRGFNTDQVVHIKSLTVFNKPAEFRTIRNQMKAIPGIAKVTVATHTPGGLAPKDEEFNYIDKSYALNHLGVDYEYFETLGMQVKDGRIFSEQFPADTTHAIVLNETAAATLGIQAAQGQTIRICAVSHHLIGIVKDSKMQGFEQLVKPTAYTLQSKCSMPDHPPKYEILVKLETGKVHSALSALEKQWSTINKKDGKYFIYDFVDQKYAALYAKQSQLQQSFTAFTLLIILVALIGLFSMSAYAISLREKEVGIRKVLGANARQILLLLNKPFIKLVTLAMIIAIPVTWWGTELWLNTFAYRIELSWWIFLLAAVFAWALAFLTVSYQVIKAAIVNPVHALRDE